MAQSGIKGVELFEDFLAVEDPIALTAVDGSRRVGPLRVVGQGMAEVDSGAPAVASGLGGVIRLTTTNENAHSLGLETNVCYDVALMGTLVAEARVQFANLTTKAFFMGFTDIAIASFVPDIETDLITASSATAISNVASDFVGFYGADAEVTASATEWHGVYNGGSATAPSLWASCNLGTANSATLTAGEWQQIRIEVDNNGTARWFVNSKLKQTVVGACSTTVDMKFFIGVGAKAATIATADLDYVLIRAGRDWTV